MAYPSPPPLRGEFPTLIRHLRPSALDGRFKLAAYLRVFICRFYGGNALDIIFCIACIALRALHCMQLDIILDIYLLVLYFRLEYLPNVA